MAAAKIAAAAAQASTITNQPTNQPTNQQQAVNQAGISITPAIAAFLLVGRYEAEQPLLLKFWCAKGSLAIGKAYNILHCVRFFLDLIARCTLKFIVNISISIKPVFLGFSCKSSVVATDCFLGFCCYCLIDLFDVVIYLIVRLTGCFFDCVVHCFFVGWFCLVTVTYVHATRTRTLGSQQHLGAAAISAAARSHRQRLGAAAISAVRAVSAAAWRPSRQQFGVAASGHVDNSSVQRRGGHLASSV